MRIAQVLEEQAIALGLALLGAAEHRVDFVHRLARHEPLQETDGGADVFEIDVEIRAREAEQHAHVVDGKNDRVGDDAIAGVAEGDDQRGNPVVTTDAPDDECARRPVEDRHKQFHDLEVLLYVVLRAVGFDLRRHEADGPLAVPVRHSEAEVRQYLVDQESQGAAVGVDPDVLLVERLLVE